MGFISVLCDYLRYDLRRNLGNSLNHVEYSPDGDDVVGWRPGSDVAVVASAQLLRSVGKKFQDEIDQEAADRAAFAKFREMVLHVQQWDCEDTSALGPYDEVVVGEFKKCLWEFFNPEGYPLITQSAIERYADFGPGATTGAEDCSFLTKVGGSCLYAPNPLVIGLFDQWVRASELRLDCEIARTLKFGSPCISGPEKITAVPKTAKISRLVKKEPSLGMFFQKGVQRVLEDRIKSYFHIDISTQPLLNAGLARLGSIDGSYCTIDLESASDCISMDMLGRFVPNSAMNWIRLLRSPEADVEGEITTLPMMATMGNAFTFPMQIVIFASVVLACYRALGIPVIFNRQEKFLGGDRMSMHGATKATVAQQLKEWGFHINGDPILNDPVTGEPLMVRQCEGTPGNFGVFGDDIVIHKDAWGVVLRLLAYLGFRVNLEKSFGPDDGPFRESCGADFYCGINVRGVYCKSAQTVQDKYILINNLVEWSARHGIYLTETIAWLLSEVKRVEVPVWENPDAGVRVPLCCVKSSSVYRAIRPSKDGKHYQGSYLYKRYVPKVVDRPVGVTQLDEDHIEVSKSPARQNSTAVLISAIRGMLRSNRHTLRKEGTKSGGYKLVASVAPCWDYISRTNSKYEFSLRWFVVAEAYFREQIANLE